MTVDAARPAEDDETQGFFERFGMRPVSAVGFDAALENAGEALVAVYFWGENCFNCEQFKKAALLRHADIATLRLHWLHANVYSDTELGRRFSLHGVPTFYFFHRRRKLGRITSWPGLPRFTEAVQRLQTQLSSAAGA
ncbi:thioredoxin family protein [Aquabacterium sp. A7-Y]|uniref:thioredoxin family protein n=1 Tax=Aquabacterium sp. A7-Y TaxID=1349605 RepID=UPI00223E0D8E|nr:thioredoxin family protein [Aquabacterium sp. A7-Y]MCW7537741.1 thioredoxin family protein [Aquabacterium sp. A7-Y]